MFSGAVVRMRANKNSINIGTGGWFIEYREDHMSQEDSLRLGFE